MDYIEEKTPDGITIKVLQKSWEYTAFSKGGHAIYANEAGAKVLHKIPVIAFIGENLRAVKEVDSELSFYKITKGEIVIPYDDLELNKRKYLFLKNDEKMDLIPIRVIEIDDITVLIRVVEGGLIFNYIAVDKSITKDEIISIKNRCPNTVLIQTGVRKSSHETGYEKSEDLEESGKTRATDIARDKNLNVMSNNPVFLARVHLRNLSLSKINQILLDFDISSLEAEYILRFIETMLENSNKDEEIEKNRSKLKIQSDAIKFYISLVNKNDEQIRTMINEINEITRVTSYTTLVAKVKLLFPKQEDLLLLTEYENQLYEMKDKIQAD